MVGKQKAMRTVLTQPYLGDPNGVGDEIQRTASFSEVAVMAPGLGKGPSQRAQARSH